MNRISGISLLFTATLLLSQCGFSDGAKKKKGGGKGKKACPAFPASDKTGDAIRAQLAQLQITDASGVPGLYRSPGTRKLFEDWSVSQLSAALNRECPAMPSMADDLCSMCQNTPNAFAAAAANQDFSPAYFLANCAKAGCPQVARKKKKGK
jgi:hypothetical protein